MRLPFPRLCLAWLAAAPAWGDSGPRQADVASTPPQWAVRLDDADLSVAGKAAGMLGRQGAAAFPAIRELLASGSSQQRWGATVALYQSTADPEPFLPELTWQLSDRDVRLVQASLGVLARLESRAAPAAHALEELLTHEEPDIRQAALATFAAIGPAARDYVPEMPPLLRDESAAVRLAAADAIRRRRPRKNSPRTWHG